MTISVFPMHMDGKSLIRVLHIIRPDLKPTILNIIYIVLNQLIFAWERSQENVLTHI